MVTYEYKGNEVSRQYDDPPNIESLRYELRYLSAKHRCEMEEISVKFTD